MFSLFATVCTAVKYASESLTLPIWFIEIYEKHNTSSYELINSEEKIKLKVDVSRKLLKIHPFGKRSSRWCKKTWQVMKTKQTFVTWQTHKCRNKGNLLQITDYNVQIRYCLNRWQTCRSHDSYLKKKRSCLADWWTSIQASDSVQTRAHTLTRFPLKAW